MRLTAASCSAPPKYSISATRSWGSLPLKRSSVPRRAVLVPRYGRVQRGPPKLCLDGHVVSTPDRCPRHLIPRGAPIFLITSSAELVLPSGRMIKSRALRYVGVMVSFALAIGAYCPFSLHSLWYRFQKRKPVETGVFGGAENSVGAPVSPGCSFRQTIFRDQDPAVDSPCGSGANVSLPQSLREVGAPIARRNRIPSHRRTNK